MSVAIPEKSVGQNQIEQTDCGTSKRHIQQESMQSFGALGPEPKDHEVALFRQTFHLGRTLEVGTHGFDSYTLTTL